MGEQNVDPFDTERVSVCQTVTWLSQRSSVSQVHIICHRVLHDFLRTPVPVSQCISTGGMSLLETSLIRWCKRQESVNVKWYGFYFMKVLWWKTEKVYGFSER